MAAAPRDMSSLGRLVCCTDELGNRWRKIITLAPSPARPTEGHLSASLHLELLFPASGLAVACECVSLAVAMLCMRLRLRPSTPSSSPHPLTTPSATTSNTSTTTTLCRSPMASAPPPWRASTAKLVGLPRTACLPSQSSGSAAYCGFRPVGVQDRPSGARLLMHRRMAVSHPMRP
jgi:hypothetical protein